MTALADHKLTSSAVSTAAEGSEVDSASWFSLLALRAGLHRGATAVDRENGAVDV
jgi:hypothetical protein